MRLRLLAALSAVLVITTVAKADTVQLFYLDAVTTSGNVLTGTFSIDWDNPFSSTANLSYAVTGLTPATTLDASGYSSTDGNTPIHLEMIGFDKDDYVYDFWFQPATASTFDGLLCTVNDPLSNCEHTSTVDHVYVANNAYVVANDYIASATLSTTPFASPTPEPSSLMLLSTGIAGVAAVRRRFLSRS